MLRGLPTALVNAKPQHQAVNAALKDFQRSSWASNQAVSLYVNSSLWGTAAAKFRKFVLRAITPDVAAGLRRYVFCVVTDHVYAMCPNVARFAFLAGKMAGKTLTCCKLYR